METLERESFLGLLPYYGNPSQQKSDRLPPCYHSFLLREAFGNVRFRNDADHGAAARAKCISTAFCSQSGQRDATKGNPQAGYGGFQSVCFYYCVLVFLKCKLPVSRLTCRCGASGSGPASGQRTSWTLAGSNAGTESGSPCQQTYSAGSPELCTAGLPGCPMNPLLEDGAEE